MTTSLLTVFKTYGLYIQQKGRPMAEAYLVKEGVTGKFAEGISASFNDRGKLIDEKGKTLGLGDLMGMQNFI